ncbi:MAG: hypothetical protein QM652_09895 [Legionella sp.]|uniref:hypothetical protein n=1 Tax=Legionella sp. TaxID=459 RepID=UPI0039E35B94
MDKQPSSKPKSETASNSNAKFWKQAPKLASINKNKWLLQWSQLCNYHGYCPSVKNARQAYVNKFYADSPTGLHYEYGQTAIRTLAKKTKEIEIIDMDETKKNGITDKYHLYSGSYLALSSFDFPPDLNLKDAIHVPSQSTKNKLGCVPK